MQSMANRLWVSYYYAPTVCFTRRGLAYVVKTPAKLNTTSTAGGFYMKMTLHHHTPTRQELYSRSVEIKGGVNQHNLRQLPQTILHNYLCLSQTILDHFGQLTETIIDNYLRLSYTTILDFHRQPPQTILDNHLRQLSQTLSDNYLI